MSDAQPRTQPGTRDRIRASAVQWGLFRGVIQLIVALYRLTGGRVGRTWMGGTVLLLTTTGRRSGRRRTLPVTYAADGDRFVVAASGDTETRLPTWLLNVRRDPLAQVQVGSRRLAVRGAEVSGEERERCWRRLVEVFPPFADYPSSRVYQIPVVLFEPVSA